MSPHRLRPIADRLYRDYLQPHRLDEFRGFVARALELGYETMTLSAFAELAALARLGSHERVLLIRHDVDSDVARARRMWEIERGLAAVATYFFRRATWDGPFIRNLCAGGCEVGYHYEELATLVKERGAATAAEALELLAPARDRLHDALAELRTANGLALDVLAAHGDFANRIVGVSNVELLADTDFRAHVGVQLEAYDVEEHVDTRVSDNTWGSGYWEPEDPTDALERGVPVVEVLVHPRAWGRAPLANAREDLRRLMEGGRFRLRRAQHRERRLALTARRGRAQTAGHRCAGRARPTDPNRPRRPHS